MVNSKIQAAEENLIHVYNRFPIALDHGEGMYLYDTEGKEYLDFAAGFAVSGLGYDNKELNQALKDQIDKLYHTSNLYFHESCGEAAKELNRISGMDRVFFTNSGGEANEGALKAARRYAYTKKTGRYEFIAMQNSFHGRSFGAVSVTGHDSYREPFEPVVPGVRFAEFNDLDSVKALVNDKTCAIILEPLQGEGGINLATQEFMEGIRKICDENGILMICDEVQCGMGRTGNMFAWQGFGVKPDILTMAKAIGNGIPVGAFAMTEEVAKYSLQPGDHGATYGGNPLACTAVKKVIEIFEREDIVGHVNQVAPYLTKKLDELVDELDCVVKRKGKGLMQGIEITKEMAGLMCSAILSDTLMFRSPTCTPVDEQIARELAQIAGIDVEEHAKAMFRAGSDLSGKTPNEIFYMDYKKFNADTIDFGVGQITSMDQGELDDIKASILEYMDSVKEEQGLDYVFFMLTNILEETTHLLICGPEAEGVIERGFGVTPEDKVAILPGVMSRKKQMIPNLLNAFQQ